ncbi:hypothetical protein D3C81_2204510 [compost metagenome]
MERLGIELLGKPDHLFRVQRMRHADEHVANGEVFIEKRLRTLRGCHADVSCGPRFKRTMGRLRMRLSA